MLATESIAGSNIITFKVDGSFTKEEYNKVVEEFLAKIDQYGKVRVLKEVVNLGSFDPEVLTTGLTKFAPQINKIERFAVIAPAGWMEQVSKAFTPFLPFTTRYFEPGQHDEALAWLREDSAEGE